MKGWVYVITNHAMPGLVKVGFSLKAPDLRAAELNHTGAPHPYVVDYEVLVEKPRDVEKAAHGLLRKWKEGKEWFRCSAEEAIAAIQSVVGTRALIENFKRADRSIAESIRRQKEVEEAAVRAADEARRKQEAALLAKRQEIISQYEPSLMAVLPGVSFWVYFAGIFIVLIMVLANFFPKMKDGGIFMLSVVGAFVIAPFVKEYFEEKAKSSAQYRSIVEQRDAELAEIGNDPPALRYDTTAGHKTSERSWLPPVSAPKNSDPASGIIIKSQRWGRGAGGTVEGLPKKLRGRLSCPTCRAAYSFSDYCPRCRTKLERSE